MGTSNVNSNAKSVKNARASTKLFTYSLTPLGARLAQTDIHNNVRESTSDLGERAGDLGLTKHSNSDSAIIINPSHDDISVLSEDKMVFPRRSHPSENLVTKQELWCQ